MHSLYLIRKMSLIHVGVVVALAALLLIFFSLRANADSGSYLIDFGSSTTTTTTTGWNNISDNQVNNTTNTYPIVDNTGAATSITLRFTDPFNCRPSDIPVNGNGTTSSTVYPATATQDSVYLGLANGGACTQNDTSAAFILEGLETNSTYDVRFYASRTAGDSINRTTNYTIGSMTVSLNATNNVDNYVTIADVSPTNGTITATVTKASSSATYGYLGVVEVIKKSTGSAPTANAGTDQTITLPTHGITLSGSGTDNDGTITSYQWKEISAGAATIASSTSATTTVDDLAAGTYTFRLTVTDNQGLTGTDDVTITVNSEPMTACSEKEIVIIGSSTAAGTGASPTSNAWVNRYSAYLQQLNANNSVINLAVSGSTTYHALPTGDTPPPGRPSPDTTHNITAAIANNPDAIIVNLPSNDIANGYSISEIEANFQTIKAAADQANIPIWFTTTQPRNLSQTDIDNQVTLRNWIKSTYATKSLDFWATIANTDGTINTTYSAGDGIHLNNLGHQKLYNRVAGSNVIDTLCTPVISGINSARVYSETITWTTNTASSSKVDYGTTTSYSSTTTETDTDPRVTNHSVLLENLSACTQYHYRVRSKDAATREQISADRTFTTTCN